MDTLIVGDPADPRTDVGPVIDQRRLRQADGRTRGDEGPRGSRRSRCRATGLFVPPTLIRIDAIEDLARGMVRALAPRHDLEGGRARRDGARGSTPAASASPWACTAGSPARPRRSRRSRKVGNLYVNRSMIGAIVGSQPFGGEGLCGTGPESRRAALSAALLRRAGDQHRHDLGRRQRDACCRSRMSGSELPPAAG